MAGNSRSGNRTGLPRAPGAGRKRKSARAHWLSGDAGKRGLALVRPPEDAGQREGESVPMPTIGAAGEVPIMLNEMERACWNLWAPIAVANGTLTTETRPGFVMLCQVSADVAQVRSDIQIRGILFESVDNVGGEETRELRKHPLWPEYRGLRQQQRDLFARYRLIAIGRPLDGQSKRADPEQDELARLLAIR
jgi:hypothetical protein